HGSHICYDLVRKGDVELPFEPQREFDSVDGIDAKIIGQLGGRFHHLGRDTEALREECYNSMGDANVFTHGFSPGPRASFSESGAGPLENEGCVDPTEPEGVRERDADIGVAGLVWHVVEVTLGI